MSDKPTENLLAAIGGYHNAFSKDKRFDAIRADLERVRAAAEKLDPVADRDTASTALVPQDLHKEAQDGAPHAQDRLDAEEQRHRSEESQNDPPLKKAAKRSREIFRTARRTAREAKSEEAADDKARKSSILK